MRGQLELARSRSTGWRAAVGVVVAVCAVAVAAPLASAALSSPTSGGELHVYEVGTVTSKSNHDVLTGAITDHGKRSITCTSQGAKEKCTGKFILSKGTFVTSDLQPPLPQIAPLNAKTCSFQGSASFQESIVKGSGTGAYAGINGSFKETVTAAGVFSKLSNGSCDTSKPIVASVLWDKQSGTVSFK